MTIKDFAKYYRISPQRVRFFLKTGKIEGEKIGRDWHISPIEMNKWKKVQHGKKDWLELKTDQDFK